MSPSGPGGGGGAVAIHGAIHLPESSASLRSLLYEASLGSDAMLDSFNATVITDFNEDGYRNKYYHSRLDDAKSNGGLTDTAVGLNTLPHSPPLYLFLALPCVGAQSGSTVLAAMALRCTA